MTRNHYLSEEEYTHMINEPISDIDERDDSFAKELESNTEWVFCQRLSSLNACFSLPANVWLKILHLKHKSLRDCIFKYLFKYQKEIL